MGISALRLPLSSRRRLPLIAVFLGLTFLILFTSRSTVSNSYGTPLFPSNPKIFKNETVAKDFFHLLIPATTPDINVCKTILSAAVLNYSTPVLINWKKTYDDDSLAKGGSHLAKIPGILSYLNSIGNEHDNDLVLIVDGYDTWFQLRPDVLLSRYHAINSRANKRITNRLGVSGPSALVSQSILFSSQKQCWPQKSYELACYAAPPSPMASDLFGTDTDKPYPDLENPYMHTRQRFLNSGLIIGPAGALRKVFTEAERRIALDNHWGSDQGIFNDILGVQEYFREVIRERHLSSWPRFCTWISTLVWGKDEFNSDRDDLLWPDSSREVYKLVPNIDSNSGNDSERTELEYEYGIGLDYGSELSHATIFSPRDADWLSFDSLGSKPSRFWHIHSPHVKTLPDDIKNSKLPFSGLNESLMRNPSGGLGEDQNNQQSENNQIDLHSEDNQIDPPGEGGRVDPPGEGVQVRPPGGNDQVEPPGEADQVDSPDGNDRVNSPDEGDQVDLHSGDDQIDLPSGDNQVEPPGGNKQIDLPSENDEVVPPGEGVQVGPPGGDDQIDIHSGDDQVDPPDEIDLSNENDHVDPSSGDDQIDLHMGDEAFVVVEDGGVRKRDIEGQLMNENSAWEQVPLYTHLWSGNIPVTIHHNAWQNNMKTLREGMWTFLWWQPFARALLDAHTKGPISPVVVEIEFGQRNGKAKSWWSPVETKGGAISDDGTWHFWDELCGEWDRDLFEEE